MKYDFEELAQTAQYAVDVEAIYNPDFQLLKHRASNLLNKDIWAIRDEFTFSGKYEDRTSDELDVIDCLNDSVVQFPSKKMLKAMTKIDGPVKERIEALIEKWQPLADNMRAAKAFIIKGRKPSENPSKTPARTYENTGTCACCGRNVKLSDAGNIVAHGYTIRWGFQSGNCFGVGYKPVEVSPEGIEAYKKYLEANVENFKDDLEKLKSGAFVPNKGTVRMAIARVEGDIRFCEIGIEQCDKKIKNWNPGQLPG